MRLTTAGSLIVTVFFGLTPVISKPKALAVFSLDTTGSDENTDPMENDHSFIDRSFEMILPISSMSSL